MSSFRPPQRVIPARVLTPGGWLRGSIHLPRFHSLLEFLAQETPYLALTGVATTGGTEELPFVAIRRSAALLLLPCCEERHLLLPATPEARARRVVCVLPCGAVTGTVALDVPLRLSDWLAQQEGFFALHEVDLGPTGTRAPVALVNGGAIVTVAELPAEAQPSGAVVPLRRGGARPPAPVTHPP